MRKIERLQTRHKPETRALICSYESGAGGEPASAEWAWNATAPVTFAGGVFTWNAGQATGVALPQNGWQEAQGERLTIDGKAFNDEVQEADDYWPDL